MSLWCLLLSLETVSSLTQATSKGSDQTAHMRRLIWGFVGRTNHFVGNFMSRLISSSIIILAMRKTVFRFWNYLSLKSRKPTMSVLHDDADQPRYQLSLIKVFTVRAKKSLSPYPANIMWKQPRTRINVDATCGTWFIDSWSLPYFLLFPT